MAELIHPYWMKQIGAQCASMIDSSHTRVGGDRGSNPRKFFGLARVETAGAPAFGVESDELAPPRMDSADPFFAGSFRGRDGRGP